MASQSVTILVSSAFVALFGTGSAALAQINTTYAVSAAVSGHRLEQGRQMAMTPDARFVAFRSHSPNIVANDTNGVDDVFVRDMVGGMTERVSIANDGTQSTGASYAPAISADGRFVAFVSIAPLVPADTNGFLDIYVRDRQLGTTTLASASSTGTIGNDDSGVDFTGCLDISADGHLVVFQSFASNLVQGDTNVDRDVFLHDMQSGVTSLVGFNPAGPQSSAAWPSMSANGRWIAYQSFTNLQIGSANIGLIYVRDLLTGTTALASNSYYLVQPANTCSVPYISDDGRYVAFQCMSDDLVPGDFNGVPDVMIRDMQAANCERVSLDIFSQQIFGSSAVLGMSGNARFVTFVSGSNDIAPGHSSGFDVYVRDRLLATTRRASLAPTGVEGYSGVYNDVAPVTDDGTTVCFPSDGWRIAQAFGAPPNEIYAYMRVDTVPPPYTAFCAGTLAACCNIPQEPWAGCQNAAVHGGGTLTAIGNASVTNDTVQLVAACLTDDASTLFFQGTAQVNNGNGASFGDGLRCVGGTVLRLALRPAQVGSVSIGHDIGASAPVSVLGSVPAAGGTRYYQAWYRDAHVNWCTSALFNLTNGIAINWQP